MKLLKENDIKELEHVMQLCREGGVGTVVLPSIPVMGICITLLEFNRTLYSIKENFDDNT